MTKEIIKIFAPSSVANVGPFYDTMGYCLNYLGDVVTAKKNYSTREFQLTSIEGPYGVELNEVLKDGSPNIITVVANYIHNQIHNEKNNVYGASEDFEFGIDLVLHKFMPLQSGLGSSAASCVASAKAIFGLLGIEDNLTWQQISNPMVEAERAATKHYYPDNILPSYFGGFHTMSQTNLVHIPVQEFATTIFLPVDEMGNGDAQQLFTGLQRDRLNSYLEEIMDFTGNTQNAIEKILDIARFQSHSSAAAVTGFIQGDWKLVGNAINDTSQANFVYQARVSNDGLADSLMKFSNEKGAFASSLSGSGPALFVLSEDIHSAKRIRDEVIGSLDGFSESKWLVSSLNSTGACELEDIDKWKTESEKNHNFWE